MKVWVATLTIVTLWMWGSMGPFGIVLVAAPIGYTVAWFITRRDWKW